MNKVAGYVEYAVFGVALFATLSSLAMSEILHFAPCVLCWYQRIFMYPLVVIVGVSIYRRDGTWPLSTMILAGMGWLVALYHTLLQWNIIPHSLAPCTSGVSCVNDDWLLGMIPVMSLMAFTTILAMTAVKISSKSKGVSGE